MEKGYTGMEEEEEHPEIVIEVVLCVYVHTCTCAFKCICPRGVCACVCGSMHGHM